MKKALSSFDSAFVNGSSFFTRSETSGPLVCLLGHMGLKQKTPPIWAQGKPEGAVRGPPSSGRPSY